MPGDRDYEVGYGKPPAHSRFKPGQSGNPKGRPKGRLNLKTELEQELKRQVVIRESGNAQKVSKQRGLVMALCNKALQGDPRAIRILVDLISRFDEEKAANAIEAALTEDDRQIIETFKDRILQHQATDEMIDGE